MYAKKKEEEGERIGKVYEEKEEMEKRNRLRNGNKIEKERKRGGRRWPMGV